MVRVMEFNEQPGSSGQEFTAINIAADFAVLDYVHARTERDGFEPSLEAQAYKREAFFQELRLWQHHVEWAEDTAT